MKSEVNFIKNIGKVKNVKRSGWVREGVKDPESVADHSWRTAMMAMVFGKYLKVNIDKLIKMILLHDLGEGLIGDKVVERGTDVNTQSKKEKDEEEIETVRKIFNTIEEGETFARLQEESSKMKTREAKILKQLERLEMAVQALEYEETLSIDLTEFFDNARMHIEDDYLKEILETFISLRPKRA